MQINTNTLVSLTDANQNFSKVARMVDEKGLAVVLKNNSPKYVILEYDRFERLKKNEEENIEAVADRILLENLEAFKELAK